MPTSCWLQSAPRRRHLSPPREHVVAIDGAESKLNKRIDDGEITINNYSAFCKDRSKRGRGVVTYCMSCLQPKRLLEDFSFCMEFVAFKVVSQQTGPKIFCCIYKPPNSKPTWVNDLNNILNHLSFYSLPITLVGDFSTDLLDDNRFADELKINFCFDQLIKCATRVTTKSSTLLDHIYTNSCLPVQAGVFSLGLADHNAIYCHFKQSGRHSMPSDRRHYRLALFRQMRHVSDISACEVLGSKD